MFNDRTYPSFTRLLDRLGVASRDTEMSFSVRCDRTGLEYNGTSLERPLRRSPAPGQPVVPRACCATSLRFNRDGADQAARDQRASVGPPFLEAHRYGRRFRDHYLLPMGASIWSCPTGTFLDFPIASS